MDLGISVKYKQRLVILAIVMDSLIRVKLLTGLVFKLMELIQEDDNEDYLMKNMSQF